VDRTTLMTRLERIKTAVSKLDAEIFSWEIGEPASMETVRAIEEKYRLKLPADFVETVTQAAGRVDIAWSIAANKAFRARHPEFQGIFSGALCWDIEQYLSEEEYEGWQFYTSNWKDLRGTLDFAEVPNGDLILFRMAARGEKKPVIYMNHDGLYTYPVQLAKSFEDYLEALLQIGLVGSEIMQLEKFIQPRPVEKSGGPSKRGAIDPACDYALAWRKEVGLL